MKGEIKNIRDNLNKQQDFIKQKFDNYTVCKSCHIVFVNGKWEYNKKLYQELKENNKIARGIICPACRQIQEDYPLGIIYIKRELIENRLDDIKNMIKNLEKEQFKENHILDRFMSLSIENDCYVFKTTTSKFGKKIANKIEKLIHKKGEYHWTDNDEYIQIYIK